MRGRVNSGRERDRTRGKRTRAHIVHRKRITLVIQRATPIDKMIFLEDNPIGIGSNIRVEGS
jgi:hypothetical protein